MNNVTVLTPTQYGGRHFVPYDKGGASDVAEGWLPNYHVPTEYFIDWSQAAVQRLRTATIANVKTRKGELDKIKPKDKIARAAVIRSPLFYFKEGITFSRTGIYAPTFRVGAATVFDTEGSSIFPADILPRVLLGLASSCWARFMVKAFIGHSVHAQVDEIKEILIPHAIHEAVTSQLESLVTQIIDQQIANPRYEWWLHEQIEIDKLVYELYELDAPDIREIELWFCRRYEDLARNQGLWGRMETEHRAFLDWGARILARPASYWRSHPVLELIGKGEGLHLDFKECFHVNRLGNKDGSAQKNVLKTIAAFANTQGGTVLLGVSDDGALYGLSRDLSAASRGNIDGLKLKIETSISEKISPMLPAGAIDFEFDSLRDDTDMTDKIVARLKVEPVAGITYLDGDSTREVWVRVGNRCRRLEGQNLVEWSKTRT